jgi:hypothetical protein
MVSSDMLGRRNLDPVVRNRMLESQFDQMLRPEAIRKTGRGPSARMPDKAHLYSSYHDILQRAHL